MKKGQLRFKTEAEFKAKFGENWRDKVEYGWPRPMDVLFGKDYRFNIETIWSISEDMLTAKRLPKLTADGIVIRVGMKLWWDETKNYVLIKRVYHSAKAYEKPTTVTIHCLCEICKNKETAEQEWIAYIGDLYKDKEKCIAPQY